MDTIQKRLNAIRNIGEKIAVIWTDEEGILFQRILDEHIKYMTFNISELEELVRMRYILGVNSKLALEKLYTAEILMNNIKDTKDKVKVLKRIFKEEYNNECRKDN